MRKIFTSLTVLVAFMSCQEQDKVAFIYNGKVINDYQMKIDVEDQFKVKDEAFKKRTDSIGPGMGKTKIARMLRRITAKMRSLRLDKRETLLTPRFVGDAAVATVSPVAAVNATVAGCNSYFVYSI